MFHSPYSILLQKFRTDIQPNQFSSSLLIQLVAPFYGQPFLLQKELAWVFSIEAFSSNFKK